MNSYQHSKNQDISAICTRDIVDLKILLSDWLKAFWQIYQEPNFSYISDLRKNTANNINVLYRILKKLITKFYNKFIKPVLGPSSLFLEPNIFFKKSGPIRNFIWVSEAISKFRKNWRYNSKKNPDGRKDGRTEGQTDRPYFVGPFWLSPEIQVSSSQAKAKSTANTNRISYRASWKKLQVSNWGFQ